MKTLLTKARLLALLLAVASLLAACGSTGGGHQGSDSAGEQGTAEKSGGMDHSNMDHGSMGPGGKARQMVMENGKYSDKAFIDAMVPHHKGAVDMAQVALRNAEHRQIKVLSRNIVRTQEAEIRELKSVKEKEFGTSQVPMDMGSEDMKAMGMMADPQELANREPFDKAFIGAMIPHHQSAIEMAQVALEQTEKPEIKELAGNIVGAQQREIEQMRQWRQAWYPEG